MFLFVSDSECNISKALDNQLNEKIFTVSNLEFKTNDLQANNVTLNRDLQFKLSRYDAVLNKLENETMSLTGSTKDLKMQIQENTRTLGMRLGDIEARVCRFITFSVVVFVCQFFKSLFLKIVLLV